MIRFFTLLFLIMLGCSGIIYSQTSGAFKAGLNASRFVGPAQVDDNGKEVDSYSFATGFHIAGGVNVKFTDLVGVRIELMYSQKGTDYMYDGQSYFTFNRVDDDPTYSTGTRKTVLTITNSYLDLPILAYYRLGRLEFSGGINIGFLTGARGSGELTYFGETELGNPIDPFTIALDFNYFNDNFQLNDPTETQTVIVDGEPVEIPKTIGPFYETREVDERLFNRFDFGLNAAIAFYLNDGLYLGFRVNYGLVDITNNKVDVSTVKLDENKDFIRREETDRNLSLQTSLGFSF